MKKIFFVLIILFLLLSPAITLAQNLNAQTGNDDIFKAKVIKILEEKEYQKEDGTTAMQQNVLLKGLEGKYKDREITFYGISEFEVVSAGTYKEGEKVIIQKTIDPEGNETFYIIDYVRTGYIYLLSIIFALAVIIIGKKRGFKSLVSLIISFLIILKFILPQIINGANPLFISLIGAFLILLVIIYVTDGFNQKSHLAIISVFFSLIITLILSIIFTKVTHLSGMAQEEAMFLIGATKQAIDFQGLLLAGILIGAVGVLDDMIIGQIEAIKQIKEINPNLPKKQIYKAAYEIGNAHIGAIINTLFLTYTGAALPLLLLFFVGREPMLSFEQIINNEMITTEIIRTLVGSIGIILSLPIATFLAVNWLKIKKHNK